MPGLQLKGPGSSKPRRTLVGERLESRVLAPSKTLVRLQLRSQTPPDTPATPPCAPPPSLYSRSPATHSGDNPGVNTRARAQPSALATRHLVHRPRPRSTSANALRGLQELANPELQLEPGALQRTGPGLPRLPAPSLKWAVVANTHQYPNSHGFLPLCVVSWRGSFESEAPSATTGLLLPGSPPSYRTPDLQPRVLGVLRPGHPRPLEVLRAHLLHSSLGLPQTLSKYM